MEEEVMEEEAMEEEVMEEEVMEEEVMEEEVMEEEVMRSWGRGTWYDLVASTHLSLSISGSGPMNSCRMCVSPVSAAAPPAASTW